MTRIEQALRLACKAHADQTRKTDGSPYIVHPLMVMYLLAQHQVSEDVLAAALLHDVLEDTTVQREEVLAVAGPESLRIIEAVSEDKTLPWEARKAAYVRQVVAGGESVWFVSVADKIHNAESLLDHIGMVGATAWDAFNRGKAEKLWFENHLYTELIKVWHHPLLMHYGACIEQLNAA